MDWFNNNMTAIETAAKEKIQAPIRRQLANMLSHHMMQLEADGRRSAQEMLKLYDGFFSILQQMETAVESRNPQVPFEFDAGLNKNIRNLEKGLESHCMWQNAARDTKGDWGDVLDPDSWPAYNKRQALDQREIDPNAALNQPEPSGETNQPQNPAGEEQQPLDLFHDQN